MSATQTLAIAATLTFAAAISANSGPPSLPKEHRVHEPSVCFEGIDKHADHVFYLRFNIIYRGLTLIEVKDDKAIKLNLGFTDRKPVFGEMVLLAIERKAFEQRKKDDPSLKWLKETNEGLLVAKLDPPESTVPVSVKTNATMTYRVTLKEGKLSVDKVDEKKPTGLLPIWVFGLIGSVSVLWLGIWYQRKGSKSGAHA